MNKRQIIKKFVPISFFRRFRFFRLIHNFRVKKNDLAIIITEAYCLNEKKNFPENQFKSYLTDAKKYLVSFDEYFYQFRFWELKEEEKEQFMSQLKLRLLYNELLNPKIEKIFWNKIDFLRLFKNFIFRDWCEISKCSFNEFLNFVRGRDVIIKPIEASCGEGIFKISKDSKEEEINYYYDKISKGHYLAEECIYNKDCIKRFHPNSLNTIRVVTVQGKNKEINILGAFIRFGTGENTVDNGAQEGILAMIDCNKGIICTDAYTKNGIKYEFHPDTNLKFRGFKLDKFSDIIKVCKKAALLVPSIRIIGWDIVERDNGIIEIIEGNHRPDAYGLQMPIHQGYKDRIYQYLN